jgi:hypothetical protein
MKTTHAPCQIVILALPFDAGSPGWARPIRKPWPRPQPDRRQGWPVQSIPSPHPVDVELIRRLAKTAKDSLSETKGVRATLIDVARELLLAA